MTKTTVEVTQTKTVTESEEITVCDECKREVDEDGGTFARVGPGWSGSDRWLENGVELHFCSECLLDMTSNEDKPAHVQRKEDWLKEQLEEKPESECMTLGTRKQKITSAKNATLFAIFAIICSIIVSEFFLLPAHMISVIVIITLYLSSDELHRALK